MQKLCERCGDHLSPEDKAPSQGYKKALSSSAFKQRLQQHTSRRRKLADMDEQYPKPPEDVSDDNDEDMFDITSGDDDADSDFELNLDLGEFDDKDTMSLNLDFDDDEDDDAYEEDSADEDSMSAEDTSFNADFDDDDSDSDDVTIMEAPRSTIKTESRRSVVATRAVLQRKVASITSQLDGMAEALEKQGNVKMAFEIDKISQYLETKVQ